MPSRWDVKMGRVPARPGPNGVLVAPALQIDKLTLRERQDRIRDYGRDAWSPLTRDEAEKGHGADEVADYFGPEVA